MLARSLVAPAARRPPPASALAARSRSTSTGTAGTDTGSSAPPPEVQLQQVAAGLFQTHAMAEVSRLRIPELLSTAGPLTSREVAQRLGLSEEAVHRVLRYLAANGVFRRDDDGAGARWQHTPLSEALRADRIGYTLQHLSRQCGPGWSRIGRSLGSGGTAYGVPEIYDGLPEIWPWLQKHPEEGVVFNATMQQISTASLPSIVSGFGWNQFRRVIDVGGGKGHLLAAILKGHPTVAEGIVFDLPNVIDAADGTKEFLKSQGLSPDRTSTVAGDFFKDQPPVAGPAGAITMKWVLHDWSDERSLAILGNVRRSLSGGRLLVIEHVQPEQGHPSVSFMDVHMMVLTGGKERTLEEWKALVQRAGLRLERVHALGPDAGAMSVLEIVEA